MAGGLTACETVGQGTSKKKAGRPNLLFVFSDQQSYDMVGCNGNRQIITPNLDKLATEGVRFTHCFSNSPVCTPHRGMLMSGQHPLYNGCFWNDIQLLTNGQHLGEVLRDAGYRTGYVGKWHLYGGDRDRPIPAGPHRHGFDDLFVSNNCTVDFDPAVAFYFNEAGEKVLFHEWEPIGQTRQALNFIEQCPEEEPFALFVSWHPPHDHLGKELYGAPQEFLDRYDPEKIELRPNCEPTAQARKDYHGYMAMCTGVDQAFGMLMEKLKEKGLAENTLVVYTSDHGDLLHSHGRPLPKTFPEEESIHVPLLMRWPERLRAARVSDLMVGTLDLMPTLLGLMDLPIPRTCQGVDFARPLIAGNDGSNDGPDSLPLLICSIPRALPHGWRGVRTRRYTYAFDQGGNRENPVNVMFDNQADPGR